MSLGLWLAFYIALSFLLGRLYASFVGWKFVRVAFVPGILLAALGRALACIVTGNDARQCDCWRNSGPAESRGGPEGGTAFRLLFAVAPFALSLAGILVADWALGEPVSFDARLPGLSTDPARASRTFLETCLDFSYAMFDALRGQKLGDASFWIFIYLAASFVVACAPSTDDLKAVAIAAFAIAVASIAANYVGLQVELANRVLGQVWRGLSLLVAYVNVVLVVSGVLFLPVKLLRDSRKEK